MRDLFDVLIRVPPWGRRLVGVEEIGQALTQHLRKSTHPCIPTPRIYISEGLQEVAKVKVTKMG